MLYDRVAIREKLDDEKFTCGLWRSPAHRKSFHIPGQEKDPEMTKMGFFRGEVIAVGKGKRLKNGDIKPMDVNIGDVVIVNRLSAAFSEFGKLRHSLYIKNFKLENDESFFVVREDDIMGIIN